MTKMVWILGKEYNLQYFGDRQAVMDLIDNAKAREAVNDLSVIAYALITKIV